jgi:CBS domain-containing protein
MKLQEILAAKGSTVYTISPTATLHVAAQTLVGYRVGALLVFEDGTDHTADRILGIVSERDLLRSWAADAACLERIRVAEVMSHPVVTGTPDDRVEDVMGLMTRERKRHLPVVAGGRLVGIVSIGDVVKCQHDQLALENRFMKDYISS